VSDDDPDIVADDPDIVAEADAAFDDAERTRFLEECAAEVPTDTCTCAADAIALLPADDIRAGMDLLPDLTAPFAEVFDECIRS
jgi:hypothetical protein